jgi:hypothetical protein
MMRLLFARWKIQESLLYLTIAPLLPIFVNRLRTTKLSLGLTLASVGSQGSASCGIVGLSLSAVVPLLARLEGIGFAVMW